MKLQIKFTLGFVWLVLVCVAISSALINWNIQMGFRQFVEERRMLQNTQKMSGNANGDALQNIRNINNANGNIPRWPIANGETPESHFNESIQNALLLSALLSVGLAIVLWYVISQWFLVRIRNLQSAMANYKETEIPHKIPAEWNDELDELAKVYNKMIERLAEQERIRKDFFIDMSHEIRTPITSIKGYLEGLLDGVFEATPEVLKKTLSETDRMGLLVKEMFALAKIESGQVMLEKEKVDLREITAEILEAAEKEIHHKDLHVTVNGQANIMADRSKCKQICINLINNAIAYSPSDTQITVEMGKRQSQIFWRIRNEAPNITQGSVQNLFERFYRADKSRVYDEKKPHLGIGLNIVKKLVELHDGSIIAEHDGKYITFEVTFLG